MAHKGETTFMNMCMIYDEINDKVVVLDKVNSDWTGLTFPGGKIESGESFVGSVIREVKEETGLDIESVKLSGIVNWFNTDTNERWILFLYKSARFSGKLIDETNEGKVFWAKLSDLVKSNLAEGMETYLKLFFDDNLIEAYATWNKETKSRFIVV